RFSARLMAPCVAISEAMLSVSPLPTALNPRQSLAPAGTAGGAAKLAVGASANMPAAASARTHALDLDIEPLLSHNFKAGLSCLCDRSFSRRRGPWLVDCRAGVSAQSPSGTRVRRIYLVRFSHSALSPSWLNPGPPVLVV